jgi:hypothetical protein
MRSRELVLLEFTQLLNLLCSFRERSPCEFSSVSKAFDAVITDAERVGVPRSELCDYMFSNWLIKRESETRAKSVAESVFSKLRTS